MQSGVFSNCRWWCNWEGFFHSDSLGISDLELVRMIQSIMRAWRVSEALDDYIGSSNGG